MSSLQIDLAPLTRELRLVLLSRASAREERQRLGPNVARCNHGPYERTRWIHNCDEILTTGPVQIIAPDNTRNVLRVTTSAGTICFAMLFGLLIDREYFIHPDRDMQAYAESAIQQFKLFEFVGQEDASMKPVPDAGVWSNYLLAIPTPGERPLFPFELHFIRGLEPERNSKFTSRVEAYDVHIVRMSDPSEDLAPVYESPFDPKAR